jgi:hypothetical protein
MLMMVIAASPSACDDVSSLPLDFQIFINRHRWQIVTRAKDLCLKSSTVCGI